MTRACGRLEIGVIGRGAVRLSRLPHKRVKLRLGAREGQSLVLVAIVPLLLLFPAFVVDAGKAFVDKDRVLPQT